MLKYRLISAFVLIPVVIAALFLLPPAGFAIVTLVVCMLAAWEWGQLSGFTSTTQRVWLAVLCGLLLALMLFMLPEYHYDAHQPMVEGSLWASFGWWIVALVLVLCRKGGLVKNKVLHSIVSLYINVVRSVPFIILLVTIMPLTRAILGTTIGSTAALVPLVVYISPYLARLIENSLLEVSPGILEAAQAMGATTWQIIRCFLMPEALGSMVLALTTGTVGLLGASAMAGYCGGGGVGDLALTYGYEKMNTPLMIVTVIVLVILVQLLQMAGNRVSRRLREHR